MQHFRQPVTLLPAMAAVFYLLLGFRKISGLGLLATRAGAKLAFKGIQRRGNMIVQLTAGEGARRGLLRIRVHRLPPRQQQLFPSSHEKITESVELLDFWMEPSIPVCLTLPKESIYQSQKVWLEAV